MRKKLLFLAVLVTILVEFSSCTFHNVPGVPYRPWNPARTSRHYGTRGGYRLRNVYWAGRHYGPRPHNYRGRYR